MSTGGFFLPTEPLWHTGRPSVTTTWTPCSGYQTNEGGRERAGESVEMVTQGGRVLCVWAARALTLTFPINEPLEGFHTGRKQGRKVVRRGTAGSGGLVGWLHPVQSLSLPSVPVQSLTRIRSKLSDWMMQLLSAGLGHAEHLPPLRPARLRDAHASSMTQGQASGWQDVQKIYCRYARRAQNNQQCMTVHDVDGAGVTLQTQEEKHVTCFFFRRGLMLKLLPH